ncbi:MAG: hypothetical protein WBA07_13880 [Rivularia sp. (in: cyanobacteria)]
METKYLFRHTYNYLEQVYEDCLKKYNSQNRNLRQTLADISNGIKILDNDEQVNAYIALYGAQHYYKLVSAFDTLDLSKFVGKKLELFSYGCGPATDTCVLISYLMSQKINLYIKGVTLIEPSTVSLNRGKKYVESALMDEHVTWKINQVNKKIDNLDVIDVDSQLQTVKLHIFSNILDIREINLEKLSELLKTSQKGSNYFLCTSPKRYGAVERIDDFHSIMSRQFQISDISKTDSNLRGKVWYMKEGKYNDNYLIDRYQRIFLTYAI